MSETQTLFELQNIEDTLSGRYSQMVKLFLVIAFLFVILLIIFLLGIGFLGYGHNWALLSLEAWIVLFTALFIVFIILEVIVFSHFLSVRGKIIELHKPKPEFINGKRIHIFTYPQGKKGGIFSKTYITIDENNILRFRTLMIPPKELWGTEK